ncbi:T9SS type A sorting domain-containing protein [Pontibacter sp. Tf4]|uniref:M43 family zinc metalloprotease n=1 Tax=Pontibacter sp. Tf4 TaxID=2761620 RepID=UPI0016266001|nr:M43 family zinc metalloprotease [Pontibacter sp. Tf4]MBB6609640.1 T9SS type A sorting domain-containing protein [Pontibacter sp. Tf4]
MRLLAFLSLALLLSVPAWCQPATSATHKTGRTCATDLYQETLERLEPGTKLQQQKAREAANQYLSRHPEKGQAMRRAGVITIPVVFHVIYNTEEQNIPDEQLFSQLAVLNADFRRTNEDRINTPSHFAALAGDAGIEFCLATTGPDGLPTNGITRTLTAAKSFSASNNRIKRADNGGASAWDRNQYLNIWVGNIEDDILGWATFPGSSSAQNDGVVLHYKTVGAAPYNKTNWEYNKGRTATHEIGHWLGLRHIWGDADFSCSDSDGIADTPNQYKPTYGCPSAVNISCNNGPYGDMSENYMDYSDDACMNLFTNGQIAYMQAMLSSSRSNILESPACTGGLVAGFEAATETLVRPGSAVTFQDKSIGVRPTSWLWEFEGGVPATSTEQNPTVSYTTPGKYKVTLTIANSQMSSTETREQYIEVTPNQLTVYPVPASDYIMIEQPATVTLRHVELINRLGQVMFKQEVTTRTAELRTTGIPSGVYILRVTSSEGTETRKVTIIR